MRGPFCLFVVTALLVCSTFAFADQSVPLTIGGKQVKVFVPEGYIRTSEMVRPLFDVTAAALPQSNRLVEYFVSESDYRDMLAGKADKLRRPGFQVQVMRSVENAEISAADWQLGRVEIAKTMGLLDTNELIKADGAKANERMSEAAGARMEVSYGEIGKPQVYGYDPGSLRFTLRVPISVQTSSGIQQSVISSVGAVTVLNGRLVFLYAYGDEKQLPELRVALDRFVDGSRMLSEGFGEVESFNAVVSESRSNGSAVVQSSSPNENLCLSYGFKVKTDSFAECLMRLDEAQRQERFRHDQYQLQLKQYQKQVADYEAQKKELERERNGRLLMALGHSIMNPQQQPLSNGSSQQMPVAPTPPAIQNYTIRKADGSIVYCSYNTATGYMSCR